MICVKFTAFCDLRIRLATLRKSVRKFWFCKLALTCVDLQVRLARALNLQSENRIAALVEEDLSIRQSQSCAVAKSIFYLLALQTAGLPRSKRLQSLVFILT